MYYPQIDVVTYNYVFRDGSVTPAVSGFKLFSSSFKVDSSELKTRLCSNYRAAHDIALFMFRD